VTKARGNDRRAKGRRNVKKTKMKFLPMLAALVLSASAAHAEDIDIFGGPGGQAGPRPNIIIAVDTRAGNNADINSSCNMNGNIVIGDKLLHMVQCALWTAVQSMRGQVSLEGKFNMGLMVYGSQNNQGGEWIFPSTPPLSVDLPKMDSTGIDLFQARVTNPGLQPSNNASASGVMQESWAFFTGNTGLSGANYSRHLGTLSCQKNFVIFIGASAKQGVPETGQSNVYQDALQSAGATSAQMQPINTAYIGTDRSDESAWSDEWARFMHQTDFDTTLVDRQSITTYTIAAGGVIPSYNQLLESMANSGGGSAFVAADINAMVQALLKIFNEIQAVNSAFASSSLPVSVNAQGTYQNQIYIGMFRPDGGAAPRWLGNLKQYKFGVGGSPGNPTLFLADAGGAKAVSSAGSGFISPNAVSFWTKKDTAVLPDSVGGFYVNNPQGVGAGYDSPDGELVEKGGVAQQLRLANLQDNYVTNPHSPRNLYTCIGSCATGSSLSGSHFATDNTDITAASLGISGNSSSVSSITRTSNVVTMVLAAAPTPALTNGQSVTVTGASNIELNGTFTITLIDPTTFTYTIVESPPSPSAGTYKSSIATSSPKTIVSLTRVGATATATTSAAHGFTTNQNITITGANEAEYNGTYPVTVLSATEFTYQMFDSPRAASTGGTATVGATSLSFTVSEITRDVTHPDNTSIVTITSGSNLANAFASGATVTVSGVTPSTYNVTATIIGGGGNNTGDNCPAGASKQKSFCYSITTTTPTTATGAPKADATVTYATTFTHTASCSPSNQTVTVTATTTTAHPFTAGQTIVISGTAGLRESAYLGSFVITTPITANTFTLSSPFTTTPPCSPNTAGVQVITNPTSIDRDTLINWVRGQDNFGDELGPGNGITIRPSVHADVLHSRPTVVNYGSPIGVVVFYGANEGVFRAINGNQPLAGGSIGTAAPGGEIWGFIPTEFFTTLKRQYLNTPPIKLATTVLPDQAPKDYYFDGSTGVYQNGSTVYLYLSARRGARLIYALNVSDPADPKFLWKKISTDVGFGELGQTWSTPKVAKVKGHSNPVLIFGAGYDTNQDFDPATSADTMGRGIFILDATNGNIVWQATYSAGGGTSCTGTPCQLSGMTYSIPSDITLLNRDFDQANYIDRLYATDTGGNIWRVDLEPNQGDTAPSTWQVTKFASLGGTGTPKRKFFYPPDVVVTKNFDMVLAVTGDREHPLYSASATSSYAVVNRFYGLKDTKIGFDAAGATTILDDTASNGNGVPATLSDATTTPYTIGTANSGFFIRLTNAGEKGVNAPTTIGGFTYFGTNQPAPPSAQVCGLGTARGYQVNFLTGAQLSVEFDGGGLPPSPVAGLVNVTVNGVDTQMPFCLGCGSAAPTCSGPDCKSSLGGIKPPIPVPPVRKRLYWYLDKHDN
jgi:type IV pilus assembly protein PilY1